MKEERRNYKKASYTVGIFTLIAIGFVAGMLATNQVTETIVENEVIILKERKWQQVALGDPVGDDTGFCEFYHYPHEADPATAYATNLSTASAYEYITSLSGEMTGETPHSTTFDYVCKIVVNSTIGYNATNTHWETDWVALNISVDYDFGTDIDWTAMTLVEITNHSAKCWYNGYINNAGSGYTLSQNQKTNSSLNLTCFF